MAGVEYALCLGGDRSDFPREKIILYLHTYSCALINSAIREMKILIKIYVYKIKDKDRCVYNPSQM